MDCVFCKKTWTSHALKETVSAWSSIYLVSRNVCDEKKACWHPQTFSDSSWKKKMNISTLKTNQYPLGSGDPIPSIFLYSSS